MADHFADDGKMVCFRGVTKMYASEQHAGDTAGMVWQLECCARRVLHGQRVWDAAQQVLARQGALYIQRHCLQRLWWYHGALLASVHQVHGVGLAVLLVSVLGFVEHEGLPIFEHTLQNALDSV